MSKPSTLRVGDLVRDNDRRENPPSGMRRILEVESIDLLAPRGWRKYHKDDPAGACPMEEHAILKTPGTSSSRRVKVALHRIYTDGKPRVSGMCLTDSKGHLIRRV